MKKLFVVILPLLLLAYGSPAQQTKEKKEPGKLKTKTETSGGKESKVKVEDDKMVIKKEGVGADLVYPYTAEYSAQFVPGTPSHARPVLELWKAWEANDLDRQAEALADTVLVDFADGRTLQGKDSVLAALKRERGALSASKATIEAWLPFRSLDRGDSWVALWAREEAADASGKVSVTRYHEMWRINKDGKIDYLRQYSAPVPPQ